MREIKFRAWDKKAKIMAYDIQRMYDGMGDIHDGNGKEIDVYALSDSASCAFGYFLTFFAKPKGKDTDTDFEVMQFTGLKDKNGKDIYEGDIMKRHWIDSEGKLIEPYIYIVKFGEADVDASDYEQYLISIVGFYCEPVERKDMVYDSDMSLPQLSINPIEVIGNVYENPGLLEKES